MARALARTLTTAALSAGLAVPLVGFGGTAMADPGEAVATLTCGSTTSEIALGDGRGEFTPAHDANSNRVFVPSGFGDFHGEIYNAQGVLVDSFSEEGEAVKGSGKQKGAVECTYRFDDVSDGSDPEFPAGYRFVGEGEVTGAWKG